MHHAAGQSFGAVPGDRSCGGLLERLVGEQPARDVGQAGELGGGFAAQPGGLDQRGGAVAEPAANGGDVGQQGGLGEVIPRDLGQRGGPVLAGQVGDVGGGEAQEGLTPVIITL